ncbi:putative harbinger transposase-derived protein [Rosa chinensis]|uniref:Putative harbinger transposase-derived protein n=1 Tax=Rosa chinensis TaxID=74649 RepID=A0A2P6QTR5_ROSCH|nr:putative harbinger transposase-derived protein [Rosa chinensis]
MDSSQISSSSLSSNGTVEYCNSVLAAFDLEQDLLLRMCANNNLLLAENLDGEEDDAQSCRRGAIPGHIVVYRDREAAAHNLFTDYFAEVPRFGEQKFRRRFRMSKSLFYRIADAVKNHDNFFMQQRDGIGRLGLSSFVKITAVFRMLAYGVPADSLDEYLKIGESTAIRCMKKFCRAIVEIFGEQYLRKPTAIDVARLLHIGEERGFPGMLGSLDCMHWRWKNCPAAWAGAYAGRSGSPTIILEAVADYDLWIWHAYFGLPGSNNDIIVLEASYLFAELAAGKSPPCHYFIKDKAYDVGYYLADGIYPKWSTLVQTIHDPQGRKKQFFATKQESCRKDVERAFGVLQSRWAIVKGAARFWDKRVLHDIMTTCIIMHNMIIEDERDLTAPIREFNQAPAPTVEMVVDEDARFNQFLARNRQIKDKTAHFELRDALIDHLWDRHGRDEA